MDRNFANSRLIIVEAAAMDDGEDMYFEGNLVPEQVIPAPAMRLPTGPFISADPETEPQPQAIQTTFRFRQQRQPAGREILRGFRRIPRTTPGGLIPTMTGGLLYL